MIRDNDHRAPLISSAVARLMHCVTPLRQLEEVEAAVASAQRDLDDSGRVELDARYLNRERYRAGRRLESARSALATAQKQRDEIEDEARRAGLYPGDLR